MADFVHSETSEVATADLGRVCAPVLSYWQAHAGGGVMPKSALDPTALPHAVLPHLMLFDVLDEGREFRTRLYGTGLASTYGSELTGKYLHEMETGEPPSLTYRLFGRVVAEARPMATRTRFLIGRDMLAYERLLLPLADAAGRTAYVLAALAMLDEPPPHSLLEMARRARWNTRPGHA